MGVGGEEGGKSRGGGEAPLALIYACPILAPPGWSAQPRFGGRAFRMKLLISLIFPHFE